MIRKIVGTIVVIFALVWIAQSPSHAGDSVHGWIHDGVTVMQHLTR